MEAIEPTAGPAAGPRAGRRPAWRWGARLVHRYLARMRHGCIRLIGPDGTAMTFGDTADGRPVTLTVHDPRFFWRTIAGGDVGFGESYIDGDWSCDDLTGLIRIFARNREHMDDLNLASALPRRLLNRAYHLARRNTVAGNRRNIQDHYDLGNEFFRLFLDPSMTYSCAVFPTGRETLEQAQRLKLQAVIDKAEIHPGDHVLEIGSGWGSLAISAARQTGCRVTSLTLSDEQKRWVEDRVARAGLQDKISVQLRDFRQAEGTFDRIVSVEMLEAVGHDNLGPYFAACDRLLRPRGRVVVQVITIRDEYYDAYRKGCDFIQRHIFPGGHVPCWAALAESIAASSRLIVSNVEDIGHHYAHTLCEWRKALARNAEDARDLGFDDSFLRKWDYYFSYCEAGFQTRTLGDLQLVLTKSG